MSSFNEIMTLYKTFDSDYQKFKLVLDRAIQKGRVGIKEPKNNEELLEAMDNVKSIASKMNALKSALENYR